MAMSGTSFSAALVSGAAADILAMNPTLDARPGEGRADANRPTAHPWSAVLRGHRRGLGVRGSSGDQSPKPERSPEQVPDSQSQRRHDPCLRRSDLDNCRTGGSRLECGDLDDGDLDDGDVDDRGLVGRHLDNGDLDNGDLDDRNVDDSNLDDRDLDDLVRRRLRPAKTMRQSQSLSAAGEQTVARGPRIAEGLPRRAQAYLLALGGVVHLRRSVRAGQWQSDLERLADVRHPGRRCCRCPVLPRRRRLVPRAAHGDCLRDRGRAAPPAGARRPHGRRAASSARSEAALPLVHPDVQHRELRPCGSCCLGRRAPRRRHGNRGFAAGLRAHRRSCLRRLDSRQPLAARDHASPRARDELSRKRSLLPEDDGDGSRRRIARRCAGELLALESLADAGRDRAARRLAPLALDSLPAAGQRGPLSRDVRVGRDRHRRARSPGPHRHEQPRARGDARFHEGRARKQDGRRAHASGGSRSRARALRCPRGGQA